MDGTETQELDIKYASPNDAVVNNDSAESSAESERTTSLFSLPQTEEEMRHCQHCEFQAEDWHAFSRHVFTANHLKKLAAAYKIRLSTDEVSNTFTCEVCIVECHGHKPWVSHLLGAKHRKALEQLAVAKAEQKNEMLKNRTGGPMRNTQFGNMQGKKPYNRVQNYAPQPSNVPSVAAQDFAQYPEPLIGLEYLTEIQVAGQNPRYDCSTCNTKFDHNLKFPHLVGQKHRINVLKLKRPVVLKGVTSKKRSEITSILARESANLELEEGRQLVKTKVKDPPFSFNANYSQQNTSDRGSSRGGRGGNQVKTWNTRGGRGSQRGVSRGASRGSSSNRGMSQSKQYNFGHSFESYPQSSTGPDPSYNHGAYNSSYESYGMTNNSNFDNSTYTRNYMKSSGQAYSGQAYCDNASQSSGSGYTYSAPPPAQVTYPDRSMPSENTSTSKEGGVSVSLAGALGDLTKLVQNEDDASVALQVSNALTQALLQYRMGNEPRVKKIVQA